jgi:proline iminopeptidase
MGAQAVALPMRRVIDVDGATLEVFLTGTEAPVVCESHPFGALGPDLTAGTPPPWPWDGTISGFVTVNPRGVGGSSPGRGPRDFAFAQHLDDLEAVRQHLGVERWVFWGGSAGGVLGLYYALQYPRSLSGLIIKCSQSNGWRLAADATSVVSAQHPQYREEMARLTAGGVHERRPAVLASVEPRFASTQWVKVREGLWVLVHEGRPLGVGREDEHLWAALEECLIYDVQEQLHEIELPTLVVASRLDEVVPIAHCAFVHAGIPQSTFVVLEESGHADPEPGSADGEKYRVAVRRFLEGIPTAEADKSER